MPKITLPSLPLSALFAVAKPSGPSSMAIIDDIKALASASRLFVDEETARANAEALYSAGEGAGGKQKGERERRKWGKGKNKGGKGFQVKIGQGGTLDPLADGVLVIGIGKATKKLSSFLDCTKEYRTTCLLGSETDSYDSEGTIVRRAPWRHVTHDTIKGSLDRFRGDIQQTPPIFSALKMDGRPLYEYARSGVPLPRPIAPRSVSVRRIECTAFERDHQFREPGRVFTSEERKNLERCLKGLDGQSDGEKKGEEENEVEDGGKVEEGTPPVFTLEMCVSGGTYVRSLAHDIGHTVGSAAHVVTLTRSRQGRFRLDEPQPAAQMDDDTVLTDVPSKVEETANLELESETGLRFRQCVPWEVFERALGGAAGFAKKSGIKPGIIAEAAANSSTENVTHDAVAESVIPDAVVDTKESGDRVLPVPGEDDGVDEEGWRPWERAVMEAMEVVEGK